MRRFVGEELVLGTVGAVLTLVVVALTGASAGATYLIAFGFLALLGGIGMRPDWEATRREKRQRSAR
jgi:hypothetical protein